MIEDDLIIWRSQSQIRLVVKSGTITSSRITLSPSKDVASAQVEKFDQVLMGKKIHEIPRFEEILRAADLLQNTREISAISYWLDDIFGNLID